MLLITFRNLDIFRFSMGKGIKGWRDGRGRHRTKTVGLRLVFTSVQ